LWCLADQTVVVVLRGDKVDFDHLAMIPVRPLKKDEILTPSLRKLLSKKFSRNHWLWAVGDFPKPLTEVPSSFPFSKEEILRTSLTSFSLGLEVDQTCTIQGFFQTADPPSALKWQGFLDNHPLVNKSTWKIFGPTPEEESKTLHLQIRGEIEEMRELMALFAGPLWK
jgi:hypothetical protein